MRGQFLSKDLAKTRASCKDSLKDLSCLSQRDKKQGGLRSKLPFALLSLGHSKGERRP